MGRYYMGDLYWDIFFTCTGVFVALITIFSILLIAWSIKDDKEIKKSNSN